MRLVGYLYEDYHDAGHLNIQFLDVFLKTLKYEILWKSLQWEPSCPMRTGGWTDRHDEASSRFSKFFERAENDWHVSLKILRDLCKFCAGMFTRTYNPSLNSV